MSTKIWSKNEITKVEEDNIKEIIDNLPHGSGINSDWFADVTDRRIYAYNTYSAMDEMGGYCHDYDFRVIFNRKDYKLLNVKMLGRELKCCGYGLRSYLDDLFFA